MKSSNLKCDPDALALAEECLKAFIRIKSMSSKAGGQEGALQREMAARFQSAGARVRVMSPPETFYSHPLCHGPDRDYADRPTVIAEVGPPDVPALLVLAHSDTVELFEPEAWSVDPFAAVSKDDSIWGLGSGDDKWGLATLVTMADALQRLRVPLRKRIIFASTIAEENGVANGTLLLGLLGVQAEAALYLDGCGFRINTGNLGGSSLTLQPAPHLSKSEIQKDFVRLEGVCQRTSAKRSVLFSRAPWENNMVRNSSRQIFHRRHDGNDFLLLPFYSLPGETREATEWEISEILREALGSRLAGYETSTREPWFEAAALPGDHWLSAHLARALERAGGGPARIGTAPKIDGFVLTNHFGIPSVSFGPGRLPDGTGRGAQHEPDEHLLRKDFHTALHSTWQLIHGWVSTPELPC